MRGHAHVRRTTGSSTWKLTLLFALCLSAAAPAPLHARQQPLPGPGRPATKEQMLSALQWANANADEKKVPGARYDVRFEWGDGAHSDVHGGWLLPGILRWMFG